MQKIISSLPKVFKPEFPIFSNPLDMYLHIKQLTESNPKMTIHNFVGIIESITRESILIETELFPKDALLFYTNHNMGLVSYETAPELYKQFYNNQRGGGQGDYSCSFQ